MLHNNFIFCTGERGSSSCTKVQQCQRQNLFNQQKKHQTVLILVGLKRLKRKKSCRWQVFSEQRALRGKSPAEEIKISKNEIRNESNFLILHGRTGEFELHKSATMPKAKSLQSTKKAPNGAYFGGLEEIRTPDLCLRRALLYPAELQTHMYGAGEGNRTLATSLEGWGSTTELHPHHNA